MSTVVELSPEAARILDQVCNRFDKDDMNNEITWAEFGRALASEPDVDEATATEIRNAVFGDWDSNADKVLSLSELKALATAWAAPPGDQS